MGVLIQPKEFLRVYIYKIYIWQWAGSFSLLAFKRLKKLRGRGAEKFWREFFIHGETSAPLTHSLREPFRLEVFNLFNRLKVDTIFGINACNGNYGTISCQSKSDDRWRVKLKISHRRLLNLRDQSDKANLQKHNWCQGKMKNLQINGMYFFLLF